MKKAVGVLITIFAIICAALCIKCATIVPAGYEGVVFSLRGGIEDETLQQGLHFVGPMKRVYLFTTSNEQMILSKDSRDGSKDDDSFKVTTSDDASIAVSFQMSYKFISSDITKTFTKFKGYSGEDIVDKRVKTVLKSKISEITTNYSLMDIYSGDRATINAAITDYLNEEFNDAYGIQILDASVIDVHPDDSLQNSIDSRVKATQEKQQAQVEQEKVKIENQTKIMNAEAKAQIKLTEAQAEADANKLLEKSLTDKVLKQMWIEKWDGKLPNTMAGDDSNLMVGVE